MVQKGLETALKSVVDSGRCDNAVNTGVRIHGPDDSYVWPASVYAFVDGQRRHIRL